MFEPIARVLAFFYSLPVVGGSVGIAIILLTGAVMILLMPLTLRATRSTIKMQEVQPKLKELQKKHKDDKQTLNAELMALYQENGINPVGGCLPMVAQLPVFLVLFNVLRGLSRRVSEAPFYGISEQARAQVGGPSIPGDTFDPRYLNTDSSLYVDLSQETEMSFGPFDLAQQARDVIQSDIVAGIPYVILIAFVVATSFYQQRQVSSRRNGAIGMNPQQEMILKVLPLASGVWSFLFPAGLVLYWATSNVFRIGQQSYITRAFYGDKKHAIAASGDGSSSSRDDDGDHDDDAGAQRPSKSPAGDAKSGAGTSGSDKSGANRSEPGKNGGKASGKNKASGNKKSGGSGPRKPRPATADASASNGGSVDGQQDEPTSSADRAEAWAKRRREQRARTQTAARRRTEQSSRITPKGTKPGSSKKKRKR